MNALYIVYSKDYLIKKVSPFIANLVLQLFGEASTNEDDIKTIAESDDAIERIVGTGNGMELDYFPWLRFFGNSAYQTIKHFVTCRNELYDRWIPNSKGTMEKGKIRGMVDWLLVSQENHPTFTDTNLRMTLQDLLHAGITTTESTIESGILILTNLPDIQEKVQMSIDKGLGRDKFPTLDDRSDLPYVDAFILETMRYISNVPFAVPHKATKDTTLGGYFIPKDTQVAIRPIKK
ncbi:unnamed protein product [Owenia fusiformis]|uniref:Uncharacterized protein n=1 Tax=Owenia fusiformis TaxID=6347 RepID=A0A8J1TDP6_OWEFU|nr:unnamed protein product [Owenia fusiformis]